MLLKRPQFETLMHRLSKASAYTFFCLLISLPAFAEAQNTSDIKEVELIQSQEPETPEITAAEHKEQDSGFWNRVRNFVADVHERAKNGARILGYTGAKFAGDAAKSLGMESVDVLGTKFDIGANVERDVKSILQADALAKYFPDQAEIDAIAKEIDQRVRSEALNGVITDKKAVAAVEIAVRETSAKITDRVLETEGVKDEARRKEWHAKLTGPFQACVSKAKTYFDAQECKSTFAAEAPANLTLAAVYEVAREELKDIPGNPAKETVQTIKSKLDQCWKQGAEIEENKDCLRQGARSGIREIATRKIDSTLPSSIRSSHSELRSQLVENFINCVSTEATTPSHSPRGESVLQTCKRDIALQAAHRIGETAIPKEIESFIQNRGGLEALQMSAAEKDQLIKSVLKAQDKCLKEASAQKDTEDLLESCIGKSIQDLSLALGTKVLDQRTREYLNSAVDESLRNEFRNDLAQCMSDISLKNYRESIDACEKKLTRDYTAKVARQVVKDVLDNGLPDDPKGRSIIEGKLEKKLDELANANDPKDVDRIIGDLRRTATYEIATRALNQEAQKQFGTKLPNEFTKAENALKAEFKKCLDQENSEPATCAKQYASALIKRIASIKLRNQIAQLKKTDGLRANKNLQADLEKHFNSCIDQIRTPELNDEFKAAVENCVASVEKKGFFLVTKNQVMPKVVAQTKNKSTRKETEKVLEEAVDCLSELNGLGLTSNKKSGNIKDLLKTLQVYFEYDPKAANQSLEAALQDIKKDLQRYGAETAQEKLIDNLARHGVIDQLIKASIRDQVKDGFKSVKSSDLPSRQVLNQILNSKNFNKIFTPAVMAKIRPMFIERVLKPTLLQGKSMTSREVTKATNELKSHVSLILAQSPHFGRMIANASVQKQLNQLDGMTRFFAHMMYGDRALQWDRVPDSPAKRKAQEYIQNELIYPKIAGKTLSRNEEARRHKIAQDLVTTAIKSPASSGSGRRVARERETCAFNTSGRVECRNEMN